MNLWLSFSLISQLNWRMLQKLREQLFPSKNMEKKHVTSQLQSALLLEKYNPGVHLITTAITGTYV